MGKFENKYTTETAKEYVKSFGCELLSEYKGMNEKHEFRCRCGETFITTFSKFQNRNKRQCNKCGRKRRSEEDKLSIEEVRNRVEKFGCKLISEEYVNVKTKIAIQCTCGNIWETKLHNFLNGVHKCPECARKENDDLKRKYSYEYVKELCESKGVKLLTQKSNFPTGKINRKSLLDFECSCGEKYSTGLFMLLDYEKFTCRSCSSKNAPTSIGEQRIEEYLKSNNFDYVREYSFDDCKYKYPLRFDFLVRINGENKLIEFDGQQHFASVEYWGGEERLKIDQERDNIKNQYCLKNNIPLLRIRYDEIKEIESKLNEFLIAS